MKRPGLLRGTLAMLAVLFTAATGSAQQAGERWSVERAAAWERETAAEPLVWFHDIFRTDGTPYRQSEVELIRSLTGRRP
jgi:hypothetical protein